MGVDMANEIFDPPRKRTFARRFAVSHSSNYLVLLLLPLVRPGWF